MIHLVISSFPLQLRPLSLPSRLRPQSSPLPLRSLSPPSSRLRPPSLLSSRLRPPTQLQLRPLDPPSSSPLEARSPPKPPDPPSVPFILVLPLLDGVIPLVYVGDTSFVSKCLVPTVCSMVLYWCVDWSRHVIVFVDSTLGCSIPISISGSLPLPLTQVLSQRFFNLILGDELISLVWYFKLSFDLSLFLALLRPFTAVCSLFTAVCSPFAAVCSPFGVFKSFCAQWQFNGLMPHISTHHVNRVIYCPVSSFMEFVLFPISSSTLCGFGVGNVLLKIRDTSNTEVLIKGFVAMLKIVDCALVAASILGFISLIVVSNFQGFISLYSSMVTEIRGLLNIISCLSVLYALSFYVVFASL
ncbi:hypothetical protein Bca52824_090102 [Brassica carinata]|uniref:Uncharacterized protein n=1 Tax=Brassica carinata TaxID=52824 RepID=A0A8X7NUC9_BRACI|nr:hypothetical protein Bca52824_090102 [Brassica carinata]